MANREPKTLDEILFELGRRPNCSHLSSDGQVLISRRRCVSRSCKHRMVPSMSRPANPYDNASCESFMKTLKREEIYANKYDDLENLRANIEEFIEQYCNRHRLHSALGYRSPEEFEQQIKASGSAESRSATMVFFENSENEERGST